MKRSVVFAACLWVSCLFTLSAQKTTIESKEENSLRVMSYNVRNCRGMDEVVDYQRVADIMNRVDPDVIAVQELDSASVRSNGVFALKGGSYSYVLYLWAFDRLPRRKVWYWHLVEGETFELLDVAPSRQGRAAFVVGGRV